MVPVLDSSNGSTLVVISVVSSPVDLKHELDLNDKQYIALETELQSFIDRPEFGNNIMVN